jgi:uncharacterized DUF497 family protein
MSVPPPGANGTSNRIGRSGYPAAAAITEPVIFAAMARAVASAAHAKHLRRWLIRSPGSFVGEKTRDTIVFCIYNTIVRITCDPAKRAATMRDRGLDFYDAVYVFDGTTFTFDDTRREYGETRRITVGFLEGRMVVVGWVDRADARHVFSMRKANEREIKAYRQQFAED